MGVLNFFFDLWWLCIAARLCISFSNILDTPFVKRTNVSSDEMISILIPVKDESLRILDLLEAIQGQDHTQYEVIILDDHSTDDTAARVANFCLDKPEFRLMQGLSLPPDWRGKNFACHQLAQAAQGDYLLFLDADVLVFPGLFKSCLEIIKTKSLNLLSVVPRQTMTSFGEQLAIPLMNYLLLTMLPIPLVRRANYSFIATACGQFMMFPRPEYLRYQWHNRVKNEIVEDVAIARQVKSEGLLQQLRLSSDTLSCRMYSSLKECIQGFSRSIPYLVGYNSIIACLLIAFASFGPIYSLGFKSHVWFISALVAIALLRVMVSFLSSQSYWKNLVLHPLQFILLGWIIITFSYKLHFGKIMWKGRDMVPSMT